MFYFIPFQNHNVQFDKRKLLSEEDLEEIVNNGEDSDKSSENISSPISFGNEKVDCSGDRETETDNQHANGRTQGRAAFY